MQVCLGRPLPSGGQEQHDRDDGWWVWVAQPVAGNDRHSAGYGGGSFDLPAVLDDFAARDPTRLTRDNLNRQVIAGHARAGEGLFIAALRRHLRRRAIEIPFDEHDLIAEKTADRAAPPPRT